MFIEVGLHRQGLNTFVLCLGVQVLFVYVTMWFSCISCTRNTKVLEKELPETGLYNLVCIGWFHEYTGVLYCA